MARRTPDLHMLGTTVSDAVEDPMEEARQHTMIMMNGLMRKLHGNLGPLDDASYTEFTARLESVIIQTIRGKFDEWRP